MKTIRLFMIALISLCFFGCTNDLSEEIENENLQNAEAEITAEKPNMGFLGDNPGMAYEISRLRKYMAKFKTFDDAWEAGYQVLSQSCIHPDGFFSGMGYHYLNVDYLDGTFEADKPEVLMVYCNDKGENVVVGVEYVVTGTPPDDCPDGEDCTPEGFTGDADQWKWNTEFGVWTLHAWVKWKNPDGFFAPMNPVIGMEKRCDSPIPPPSIDCPPE